MLRLLAVALLALPSLSLAANPQPGAEDPYCLLDTVSFSNGVSIAGGGGFDSKTFSYSLNCPSLPLWTIVTPRTFDPESTAEITFNSVAVNTKAQGNAVSNQGNVQQAPNTQSNQLTFSAGQNSIVIGVSCNGMGTPPCYYQYTFTCNEQQPGQGGQVIGDPQFTGLRGQSYQVHGVSGEIYNIVSDPAFQLNARFVFLDHGHCPVVDGKKQRGCWAHPGSYLGAIGLKTAAGDRLELVSGPADSGFAAVRLNGKELAAGDAAVLKEDMGSIAFNNSHTVQVSVNQWTFVYENSDLFVNQRVSVANPHTLKSHGLLGQTHSDKTYNNAVKFIQGQVDDYVIREKDLFGDSFVYNKFN